jgi:hypothetical protein
MSNDNPKLLLILSVILVSLLSNKSSTPFFEFEGKGIINQYAALALGSTLHEPSQNNTDIRSITSPINRTNSSLSADVSILVQSNYFYFLDLFFVNIFHQGWVYRYQMHHMHQMEGNCYSSLFICPLKGDTRHHERPPISPSIMCWKTERAWPAPACALMRGLHITSSRP